MKNQWNGVTTRRSGGGVAAAAGKFFSGSSGGRLSANQFNRMCLFASIAIFSIADLLS